jgi:hypothetical protein
MFIDTKDKSPKKASISETDKSVTKPDTKIDVPEWP